MSKEPVYTPDEEMEIMATLWSDKLRYDPFAFVMINFPWGEPDTPLENERGPRKWQARVLRRLSRKLKANRDKTPDELNRIAYDVVREAIASGRGIGKSALLSWLANWMATTRIGSTTAISANSEDQLTKVTWPEMGKWFSMGKNAHWWDIAATTIKPEAWLSTQVDKEFRRNTKYWGVFAKLWTEQNPSGYAGIHNMDGVMLIFDEASHIPDSIWSVAAGFFTENTPNRFWFAFSNPRRNRGYFFECFNSKRDFWEIEVINALEVEGTDQDFYRSIIKEYGPDSMEAHVEVYGEFPEQGDDQFISPMLVNGALNRPKWNDPTAPIIIGVDPARGGTDSTVVVVRQGRDIVDVERFKNGDTMETVGHVIDKIEQWQPDLTVIDEGGVGAGIVDRLKEQKYKVRGVNFANSPRNLRAYVNKRAEMWGDMRSWLATASMIIMQNDRRVKTDLTAPMVKYDSSGAIQLESKKEMRSRGVASPDTADAIAVTFAFPVGRRRVGYGGRGVDRRGHSTYPDNAPSATSWMGS